MDFYNIFNVRRKSILNSSSRPLSLFLSLHLTEAIFVFHHKRGIAWNYYSGKKEAVRFCYFSSCNMQTRVLRFPRSYTSWHRSACRLDPHSPTVYHCIFHNAYLFMGLRHNSQRYFSLDCRLCCWHLSSKVFTFYFPPELSRLKKNMLRYRSRDHEQRYVRESEEYGNQFE